jgi:hypothetical protein
MWRAWGNKNAYKILVAKLLEMPRKSWHVYHKGESCDFPEDDHLQGLKRAEYRRLGSYELQVGIDYAVTDNDSNII